MEAYERYNHGSLLNERYSKVADISEGSYGLVSLAKDTKANNALVAVKYIYPVNYNRAKTLREQSKATGRATSSPAKLRSNVDSSQLHTQVSILNALCEESAKEIRIHKILGSHTNITSLIDHFDSCLVLEYCSRGDLYEAIQSDTGPSTSQDVKDVFGQILDALEYCHGQLVFHRDLKPENILITEDWTIKICDWGLATTQRVITNKSEFDVGSERYMAPELFDPELESYDAAKIDLWSVGVILLTLVFHKNPFKAANYTDKRFLQFSANREALFDFFSVMSGDMFSVLRLCLTLDPQNRDLPGLRAELEKVKYFTVDEEYWATHSDEEDEEADTEAESKAYDEQQEPYPEPFTKPFTEPFTETFNEGFKPYNELFNKPFSEAYSESFPERYTKPFDDTEKMEPAQQPKARAHFADVFDDADDVGPHDAPPDMPYNRRADALRLLYTGAEPIPIGRLRNTRKPFGVASYTRSAGRAAFSHTSNNNGYNNGYSNNGSHLNGNSVNYGNNGNNGRFRREDFFTPRSVFNHYMDKYGEHKEREKDQKRRRRGRKRQSWKKRHPVAPTLSTHTAGAPAPSGHAILGHAMSGYTAPSHGGSMTSSDARRKMTNRKRRSRHEVALSVPMLAATSTGALLLASNTGNSHGPSPGKYVPPFLRLPKSPAISLLVEEIDHLNLDEDMFHLEDVGGHESSATDTDSSRRDFLAGYTLPMDPGCTVAPRRGLAPHGDGKYIPPFRRGSHLGIAREKRRLCNPLMFPSIQQSLDEKLLGVDDEWMTRKNWSEY